ncbi:MAG TPA: HDOD domain-containing protein [Planctomycetes bacterium]|nr:HDOD domain-containing protein [Planctomycetota bacterium]
MTSGDLSIVNSSLLEDRLRAVTEQGTLELPVLPDVALKVTRLCGDEECDQKELADVIRRDQSLMAHLLRVANSAIYGGRVEIVSLQLAVNRLGLAKMREIVLAVACKASLFGEKGPLEEMTKRLFQHSMVTAACSQEVARRKRLNVEEAFTVGLLHDVGRPVLLHAARKIAVEEGWDLTPEELLTATNPLHADVGAEMLASWGLPDTMVQAIRHHHTPDSSGGEATLPHLLRFADDLAHLMMDDASAPESLEAHPDLERLNLYPDDVEWLLERQSKVIEQMEAYL